MDHLISEQVGIVLAANMAAEARLIADEALFYKRVGAISPLTVRSTIVARSTCPS